MSVTLDRVDLYTVAMNSAFIKARQDGLFKKPAIDDALTIVPSTSKIENYPFLYPAPQVSAWQGYRNWARLAESNYRIENKTYSVQMEIKYENLADDQVGMWSIKADEMAKNAMLYKYIAVQQLLAVGQTTACFDGSNFFATSHNIGGIMSGGNIVSATTAGSDGITHAMVVMLTTNSTIKPLLWQDREEPSLQTDLGSPESRKLRLAKWWADLRGAAGFGMWWDACLVKFANTPTVAEVQTAFSQVTQRFRSVTYPVNLSTDPLIYVHINHEFSQENTLLLCSGGLEHLVRQAVTLSLIGATENAYQGFGRPIACGYLNGVV